MRVPVEAKRFLLAGGAAFFWVLPLSIPKKFAPLQGLSFFTGFTLASTLAITSKGAIARESAERALRTVQEGLWDEQLAHWTIAEEDRIAALYNPAPHLPPLPQPVGAPYQPEIPESSNVIPFPHREYSDPRLSALLQLQPTIEESLPKNQVDYSWLDQSFIDASKGVFGQKGSGKSTYLRYEAIQFLMGHSNGELLIGDVHFDEEDEKTSWLMGVPMQEQANRYVSDRPDRILAFFRRARSLLDLRVKQKIRNGNKFKFICDEFIGTFLRWNDDERAEVLETLQFVQFEGRKFGVDITLGLHSIKKQQTGIDSSVLANMDLLCLGNSLADTSTKFPADFDVKALLKAQQAKQQTLNTEQGFACVVRRLGDVPRVQVLPYIDLKDYLLEVIA